MLAAAFDLPLPPTNMSSVRALASRCGWLLLLITDMLAVASDPPLPASCQMSELTSGAGGAGCRCLGGGLGGGWKLDAPFFCAGLSLQFIQCMGTCTTRGTSLSRRQRQHNATDVQGATLDKNEQAAPPGIAPV